MTNNRLYWLISSLAFIVAAGLSWFAFPSSLFLKMLILLFVLVLLLSLGFWRINFHHNIQLRNQLYKTIATLEEFDIDDPTKVTFSKSSIGIFNELNDYLQELITRIRRDYQANKQFTQNATHELQTPLAIIKGHIEMLLQSSNIREKEIESLGAILHNTNRLSRLISALILLSKIENQVFPDIEVISIVQLTIELLNNFKDAIEAKGLEVTLDEEPGIQIEMSRTLAEILIANLIQNAIRHNLEEKGFIKISFKGNSLSISNPGPALEIPPEQLFKRFKRESELEEGLGLGLAIVKRICALYGFGLDYAHLEEMHTLRVSFQKVLVQPPYALR